VREVREGMGVHGGGEGGLCREGILSTEGLGSLIGGTDYRYLEGAMGLMLL